MDQKRRLGGNMAIANTINKCASRTQLRKLIGPDLVFIVLNLTEECLRKRILQRHGEVSEKLYNIYLEVPNNMSQQDQKKKMFMV